MKTLEALIERICLDPAPQMMVRPRYQRARRLSEREIDELVELYLAGATMVEVGERLLVNRHTVGKHLADRGVQSQRNRSGLTTPDRTLEA